MCILIFSVCQTHIGDTAWIGHPHVPDSKTHIEKHCNARYCDTCPCRCRVKSRR
jgi:hypothetical protein